VSDYPTALAGFTPKVGKTREIETTWTIGPVTRALEVHQFRLLRVQGQSKLAESLWEYLHYTFRITLGCKHKHSIVCVADEERFAPYPWQNVTREPKVQHFMEV
jgi:hypothetical protein